VDSVASAPNVGFKQVIAPGAFVMLGLRGIPLSVGAGTSAVPTLRTVTLATGGAQQRYAFRPIDVRIAVDIPLFP